MAQNISRFTSTGKKVKGISGSGPLATPGVRTEDGKIYQPRRNEITGGIGGKSVRITNPKAAAASLAQRTTSLGMGGVGQRGRHTDF